jgi:hypothetical protein
VPFSQIKSWKSQINFGFAQIKRKKPQIEVAVGLLSVRSESKYEDLCNLHVQNYRKITGESKKG